jgi:uncharacterized protein involved in type VI secretion and phage assembly
VHSDYLILEYLKSHFFGKYRGIVVDNDDPTQRGRLQVQVPAVLGEVSVWAMPCVPYAGENVGFYSLPPKGSGVWVEFEAGDPSYAVWTGCFWADNELPETAGPDVKIWKTDSLIIRLDDSGDELLLENGSESRTTYASEVTTESGAASVTVGTNGGVSVNINDDALEVT